MKVIILGSGKSIHKFRDYPYRENGWKIVVLNNAYTFTQAWHVHVRTLHFERTMEYASNLRGGQRAVNDDIFNKIMIENYGHPLNIGQTISIAGSYYSLYTFKPDVIGYLGNDFNYTPDKDGSTTFYGLGDDIKSRGVSDPDLMARYDGHTIQECFEKFEEFATKVGCECVNFSDDPDSRLPFKQRSPEIYDD